MAGNKTPKKKPSAAQSYYKQSSGRVRGNESLERLTEGYRNAPAGEFSHSVAGRTGSIPNYRYENVTPAGSRRKNNYTNPYMKPDLATYLTEKAQLRELNVAIPDASDVRNRQIGRPHWNPPNGRYGKVLLPSAGHNQPRIPRNTRARGGPGLMGMYIAGGLGTLTKKIIDNNRREMRNR